MTLRMRHAAACVLLMALSACTTWQQPETFDVAPLRARAVSATNRGVTISASVLSAEDGQRMYGANIVAARVQPVWFEVTNRTDKPLWLLRSGTDPDYFSPLEVAWSFHSALGGASNQRIDNYFNARAFQNPVPPGATHSGVLFTNPDHITKLVNVDLVGTREMIPFTLFVPVPGDVADVRFAQRSFQYAPSQMTDVADLAALRAAIEKLPCCATDTAGTSPADPLNVVVVGNLEDIAAAMVRRSYRRNARPIDFKQHLFGRPPDVVVRKQAQMGAPATWLRAWVTPLRFQGREVYVAQVGRPVGGRFASRNDPNPMLQSDVDEARNLFIQDIIYSGGLDKIGFAAGVGVATVAQPRQSLGESRYATDGLRAVLFFATRPLSLSDVQILDWVPYLEQRERAAP